MLQRRHLCFSKLVLKSFTCTNGKCNGSDPVCRLCPECLLQTMIHSQASRFNCSLQTFGTPDPTTGRVFSASDISEEVLLMAIDMSRSYSLPNLFVAIHHTAFFHTHCQICNQRYIFQLSTSVAVEACT